MCVGVWSQGNENLGENFLLLTLRAAMKSLIAFDALFGNFSPFFKSSSREVPLSLLSMNYINFIDAWNPPEKLCKERS